MTVVSVAIPGLPGRWREIAARYDYPGAPCRCPKCGGLGVPWGGWYSCEDCSCVALVADGRAFVPAWMNE